MLARDVGAFLTGLIIIAVIFVLVRPGSNGPAFVKAIGDAIANMLNAASGGNATQTATGTGTGSTGTAAGSATPVTVGTGAATAGTTTGVA